MERKSTSLAWPFSYFSNPSMAHNHLSEGPDNAIEAGYTLSLSPSHMAADRPGSFLAPCYWPPPHYSTPYGVAQHSGASSQHGKRGASTSSCECTTCVTSPTLNYKPFFMTPQETRSGVTTTPLYVARETRQPLRAAGSDAQSLKPATVSPPLCVTEKEVSDNLAPGPRRGRTVFTAQQLQVLERVFSNTQYIVGSQRKFLANQLRLSETQVRVWFQNRRIKWRKQMLTHSI